MLHRIGPVALVAICAACTGTDEEADDGLLYSLSVHPNNATGDDARLCDRLSVERTSMGPTVVMNGVTYHVIQGDEFANTLTGSSRPDLIFGGDGDDKIYGGPSADIICAGGGADFVDGGSGQDRIYGGPGNDVLHGGMHGDWIHGDDGNDDIFGDLLDDKLFGDDGDDLIVGGHGVDHMEGGRGKDWLRGDTNSDDFIGGLGYDVASFATARPSGRGERNAPRVMQVDTGKRWASGDGYDERVKGIEQVIGSPFNDELIGHARFSSGFGDDLCNGAPCGHGQPPLPFAYLDDRKRDTGVVVLGGSDPDKLYISHPGNAVTIFSATGAAITAGPGCEQTRADLVTCTPSNPLRYVLAWGGGGDDELKISGDFPRDFEAHLDGGEGSDTLTGHGGADVLFGGRSGNDILHGGNGDDALISESYEDDRARTGDTYGGGEDKLYADDGNDQLVSDYPCGHHYYSGGPGLDIAGFARVGARDIHAQLRGPINDGDRSDFFGKAFLPNVRNPDTHGTYLEDDMEILEGSKGNDQLYGNQKDNIIWGRQGNDIIRGFGGNDSLWGDEGNDQVFGGDGDDKERP
jgi:Ca2+-binding RTX toxin-like protein